MIRVQLFGLTLLFMSLCFDGGTGAYEDKLMCKHHVGPFDLMFNIQFAKMLLAGLALVITGQITLFFKARLPFESPVPFTHTPPPVFSSPFLSTVLPWCHFLFSLVNKGCIIQHVLHDKCMKYSGNLYRNVTKSFRKHS